MKKRRDCRPPLSCSSASCARPPGAELRGRHSPLDHGGWTPGIAFGSPGPRLKTQKTKKRDRRTHVCTHLSGFPLVSRAFPSRYAKKYTGYCIIACVPMCVRTPVIIQFGVSYLQTRVGARWAQIMLCKPFAPIFFCRIHPIGRCASESALV